MGAAADREEATEKHPVTPGPIIPARELLGEMLLAADQPQAALQAFEASMRVEPNRFWGLYGAARAAELAGERDKAKTHYAQLIALAERADSERPALAQAKEFMGKH
jgi:predicted Zn-dependent protease